MESFTTHRRPIRSRGTHRLDGGLIKPQKQNYCCRLILKTSYFYRGACSSTRYPDFTIPVETFTAPDRIGVTYRIILL